MTDNPLDTCDSGLEHLVKQAKYDLAGRLSISAEAIELLEAKMVSWPDASAGCPQPGMQYKQIPIDGACIRLAYEGKIYEYHSGGIRGIFLCEPPVSEIKKGVTPIDIVPPSVNYAGD